jgi:hypothetical protein
MRDLRLVVLHLAVTAAKLCGHGGVRAVIAENLVLKKQLIVLRLAYVPFWNGRDLERKLAEFQRYYNAARSHASLGGHTPLTFAGKPSPMPADLKQVRWACCRNLLQLPVAA